MIYDIPGTSVCVCVSSLFWCGILSSKNGRTDGPMVHYSPKTNRTGSFRFLVPGWEIPSWVVSLRIGRIIHKYIDIYVYIFVCLMNMYICVYIYIYQMHGVILTNSRWIYRKCIFLPMNIRWKFKEPFTIQRGIMVISGTNLTFPKTKIAPSQKEGKDRLPLPPLVWRV